MLMFTRTHELFMQLEALKQEHLTKQLQDALAAAEASEANCGDLSERCGQANRQLAKALSVIASQQQTIAKQAAELLLLSGNVRREVTKQAEKDDPYLKPDIDVRDERDVKSEVADIESLRAEIEQKLAVLAGEVDITNVTVKALAAATPASVEDWQEEHKP